MLHFSIDSTRAARSRHGECRHVAVAGASEGGRHRNRCGSVSEDEPFSYKLGSGLLAALLGIDAERIRANRSLLGPFLETFVYGELTKQAGWSDQRLGFFHFRTKEGREVDMVMEDGLSRIVGIEVKASATVRPSDFGGWHRLAEACGDRFILGGVCYDGDTVVPFGELWAIPVSNLWQ